MIAPAVCAELRPMFYGIDTDGLPLLDTIDPETARQAGAIIVAHYFGRPQSLRQLRDWCDKYQVALVEDCAHCFFGMAGDRPVGAWGDYATASLSKFFPVPEAGLLVSHRHTLRTLPLRPRSVKERCKGWLDVLEYAAQHRRLGVFNPLMRGALQVKNFRKASAAAAAGGHAKRESMLAQSDMGRIECEPLGVATWLYRRHPRHTNRFRRRQNFAQYRTAFEGQDGCRPLLPVGEELDAPYVFPLWVDDGDRVYHALRTLGYPVFRWDRVWPLTPSLPGDQGPLWSRHVLQLLCHQDLRVDDIAATASAARHLIARGTPCANAMNNL